jgi:hypothetical protein
MCGRRRGAKTQREDRQQQQPAKNDKKMGRRNGRLKSEPTHTNARKNSAPHDRSIDRIDWDRLVDWARASIE